MLAALATRVAAAVLHLPPRRTHRVRLTRDIPVRVRDGVSLRTDHHAPDRTTAPTVLIRTPYGRGGPMRLLGRLIGERGYHVVIQSCRGTGGSGGQFDPLVHERDDGLDTLDWLRRQPWWNGTFGMFGASYQGFVQWAVAADAAADLRAMVAVVTASGTRDSMYPGESFALDTVLTWVELLQAQTVGWLARQWELRRGQPRLAAGLSHLPLAEADRVATGMTVPFFQEWLRHHTPDAAYWQARVFGDRLAEVHAPVAMIGGWHDIFLPAQLRDFAALRDAGAVPRLIVGPWTHGSPGLFAAALRDGLDWLDEHLGGYPGRARAPVRVHVGGSGGGWRELPDWPPPATPTPWYLHPRGGLRPAPSPASAPDGFWYDPGDPTPSVGGPLLVAQQAGPVDNRHVEARPDVLTWTSAALPAAVEVIGPVEAEVFVRSELPYLDVFVRLCDVDRRGRSWNICDGLVRVSPPAFAANPTGAVRVAVPLWPVAHRFAAGHRLRVQVCGGAHPRYARNPGTGEPLGTATALQAGWREILHDPQHPSALVLPIARDVSSESYARTSGGRPTSSWQGRPPLP
ncbi:CocE/NonD family hydrolase [Salinispora tropica]|uniref:Peptidase S15 n=1 Tax=Salinispora tropica (strain ATCC BAA-916 / DSM 44818 / JCM 13857 / NBRC 105044 / CNB-440) TaxID=369723 RepID=A4X9I7_SALTO|nr:CocE/NonD family hydrolase [Salinispora tropica]ABP55561.1 peptidase S15 [Salinispora tropica CNB-440]